MKFVCGHMFCLECTLEQLNQLITCAEVAKVKCFDYKCLTSISDTKLQEILSESGRNDLMERYKYFRQKKDLEKDPLVRYCPKAGCDQYLRAENSQSIKL